MTAPQPEQQDVYWDLEREELAPLIPRHARRAMDVGCARGGFGRTLRATLGSDAYICGVEPVESQAAQAALNHGYDTVIAGYFPQDTEQLGTFDLITLNDVLEHLIDPWAVLSQATERLSPGGHVLASIPSIQYLPVLYRLARGSWEYAESGTLDRTHVRFFTRSSMIEMFEGAGLDVVECRGINSAFDAEYPFYRRRYRWLRRLAGDTQYLQFALLGRKRWAACDECR